MNLEINLIPAYTIKKPADPCVRPNDFLGYDDDTSTAGGRWANDESATTSKRSSYAPNQLVSRQRSGEQTYRPDDFLGGSGPCAPGASRGNQPRRTKLRNSWFESKSSSNLEVEMQVAALKSKGQAVLARRKSHTGVSSGCSTRNLMIDPQVRLTEQKQLTRNNRAADESDSDSDSDSSDSDSDSDSDSEDEDAPPKHYPPRPTNTIQARHWSQTNASSSKRLLRGDSNNTCTTTTTTASHEDISTALLQSQAKTIADLEQANRALKTADVQKTMALEDLQRGNMQWKKSARKTTEEKKVLLEENKALKAALKEMTLQYEGVDAKLEALKALLLE